jgi:hypothetical protein
MRIHRSASSTALAWLAEGRLQSAGLYRIVDPRDAQAVHDAYGVRTHGRPGDSVLSVDQDGSVERRIGWP